MVIVYLLLPMVVHELGHYLAGISLGSNIVFKFEWGHLGKVPIPRFVWTWPDVPENKIKIICQAGFLVELGFIPFMPWQYQLVALLHFATYPWYAGNSTDFKGMI